MKFVDLLEFPYNKRNNIIELSAVIEALPRTPPEVATQFYCDHGRNAIFQRNYGAIDIGALSWERKNLSGADLQNCTVIPQYTDWVDSVKRRLDQFQDVQWRCIDSRSHVWQYWEKCQTWLTLPVFVLRTVIGSGAGLHLVEGHTRMGVLCGLLERSLIPSSKVHSFWLGALIETTH